MPSGVSHGPPGAAAAAFTSAKSTSAKFGIRLMTSSVAQNIVGAEQSRHRVDAGVNERLHPRLLQRFGVAGPAGEIEMLDVGRKRACCGNSFAGVDRVG